MLHQPRACIHSGLPHRSHAALELLVRGWDEPERSLQLQSLARAIAGECPDLVCAHALEGDRLTGIVVAQMVAGRAAAVFPPQLADNAPESLATEMLGALHHELAAAGVHLAQGLLSLDQVQAEARLVAAGYESAATLLYMVCDRERSPQSPPAIPASLEAVRPEREADLQALIEATYEGTLDCPLLNGMRTTADVIAGYRAVGTYRPELWLVARDNERDLGCLLLADHPEHFSLELVYLGLIPTARGKGIGQGLAKHALWLARQAGRERVVLAVDAANAPAIGVYEAAGFLGFDQRQLMIKQL